MPKDRPLGRLEFRVVFNESNDYATIEMVADFIEKEMDKMKWKTHEEELNLLRKIVEVELGGKFIVINENKVKADFSDPMWIPCFD
jgi:hypothetical protein